MSERAGPVYAADIQFAASVGTLPFDVSCSAFVSSVRCDGS